MNCIKHLLIATFSLITFSAVAQWTEVQWSQEHGISNIDFVDDITGYAQMHLLQGFTASFEKTQDGGQTWTEINIPVNPYDIQDMDFLSDGTGALVTRSFIDGENVVRIFRTFDDGLNWEDISPEETATGFGMAQIQMLDEDTFFFVTDTYFYRTIDAGANWDSVLLPAAGVSVSFSDANHGVVGTWDTTFNYFGGMLATTDGGVTWSETMLNINYTVMGAVKQLNATTALAAPIKFGGSGQSHFYKTTDSGLNWDMISVPETEDGAALSGFDFQSEAYGVVTLASNEQLHIYATTDGGENWIMQNQFPPTYVSDMNLTPNSGYIVDEGGYILRLNAPNHITELKDSAVSLYPNPASKGALLQWNSTLRFTQIRITDGMGRIILNENLNVQSVILPELQRGVYFVTLQHDLISQTVKLVMN